MVLHNPNNWHWVDKNCIAWSREWFQKELVGLKAASGETSVSTTAVPKVDGDVEVCQRKGKVISLFDVAIEVSLEGASNGEDFKGKISIPEVAYDSSEEDYQFEIQIGNDKVKALVRKEIVPQLRARLAAFGPKLIATHGGEIQHSGNEPIHWTQSKITSSTHKAAAAPASTPSSTQQKAFGVSQYNTTTLEVEASFNASPQQIYEALMDPKLVAVWSRSAPHVEAREGGHFALFGGGVSGKFVTLKENEQIKLLWRLRDWKSGHFAEVTYDLVAKDGETSLATHWKGVPVGQEEAVQQNFQEYYIKPIKLSFGYGLV